MKLVLPLFLVSLLAADVANACEAWGSRETLSNLADDRLDEISGIVGSDRYPDHFWVHNDSGDDARLYLIARDGTTIASTLLADTPAVDFEDIGRGPCGDATCLWLADIGDNNAERAEILLYQVKEPDLDATEVVVERVVRVTYEDGPRDSEAFWVEPLVGDRAYLFEKNSDTVSGVYTIDLTGSDAVASRIGEITTDESFLYPNQITAADISSDGQTLVFRSYIQVYSICLAGRDVADALNDTLVESVPPPLKQAEALAVVGDDIWLTSERRPTPLVRLFREPSFELDAGRDQGTTNEIDMGVDDMGVDDMATNNREIAGTTDSGCSAVSSFASIWPLLLMGVVGFVRRRILSHASSR